MYQFILLIHMVIAGFLILLVLIQQGKGASMGAAFGSGASQTVFGSRGSGSFLMRMTIGLALLFFVTSIMLNRMAANELREPVQHILPTSTSGPASAAPYVALPPAVSPETIPASSAPAK